jgi:hypothetical protein
MSLNPVKNINMFQFSDCFQHGKIRFVFIITLFIFIVFSMGSCKTCKCPAYSKNEFEKVNSQKNIPPNLANSAISSKNGTSVL